MIAPAIQPSSNPCALPILINAIPIVAIVVHELPVMTEISTQIMQVDARKKTWVDNLHSIIKQRRHYTANHPDTAERTNNQRIMIAVVTPATLFVIASS